MNTILSKYAIVIEKIYWFAYLQVLWVLFSLLGFIVFGVFPATHALIMVLKEKDLSSIEAFRIFRNAFTRSFIKLSGAGIVFLFMFVLLIINVIIFQVVYMKVLALGMLGLVFLSMLHFFQYFELGKPIVYQVKRAFSFVWVLPKNNVGYVLAFMGFILSIAFIPGIAFFFGVSITMFFVVKIGNSEESQRLLTLIGDKNDGGESLN
ncbi:DUF624 domain-containing protein [Paraliobacillus salinarum]|uniref:DUF624 domain-containing protein n=1 Tax=Paraliobacillus salinarum TaxID=1158996 RepID=UPI0015F4D4D7|nr:DUF624 domain-containing protein [Paraliobacillus salinarum]